MKNLLLSCIASFLFIGFLNASTRKTCVDVLIIGGGASGTTAGIQAARLGVNTLITQVSDLEIKLLEHIFGVLLVVCRFL